MSSHNFMQCKPIVKISVMIALCIVMLLVFVPAVQAAGTTTDELHAAPLNPEFIAYTKEKTYDSQVQSGTHGLGLVPSPIYRPNVKDVQMFGSNAGDRFTSYPATYDLRTSNKVSPVKDQNPWGTCWAFATFASLESTSMPATPTPVFSEKNLVNLAGYAYADPKDAGGNMKMSTAYLTRWNGPVNSATDPYPSGTWTSSNTYPPVKHVQNVISFPGRTSRTDTGNIKGALMQWGAVYSSLDWYDTFYNQAHTSYYQPASDTSAPSGHAVTIIGWDDNFAATNFTTAADGPGAWLVKNSWGTAWGNGGYFYVSYYDKCFGSAIYSTSGSYKDTAVFLGESTSNYDTVYSYDKLGEVTDYYYGTAKTGSFANVFTANTSETIKAVGFYTTDLNVAYTISIYKNPTSGPIGGTPAATFSGTISNMGYNTTIIPSNQQVSVTTGDRFSVVVQVTNPTNNYYIPVEANSEGYTSGIVSQLGQGYWYRSSSGWIDAKTILDNSHVCVKAYTSSTTIPTVTGVSPSSGTINGGTTVTITGTNLTGATAVHFGTTAATNVNVVSATSITATSPAHAAGIVDVTVTTPSGTSAISAADQFTYAATPTTNASTIGIFRTGNFYLASSNINGGGTVNAFNFGMTGDVPVTGDWNGDGTATVGIFRTGNFYLASSNIPGGGTVNAFNFGMDGDVPVAGKWSGSGAATVGIFRSGNFFLASSNIPGGGTVNAFNFGMAGDVPVAGDWNGDGTTTVGIFRSGNFFLASSNIPGGGTVNAFNFGMAGDVPVVGDWNADGKTEVGIFRNGAVYLASSNIPGGGTVTAFTYGMAGDEPVAGKWT